jgi:hypothetical protein
LGPWSGAGRRGAAWNEDRSWPRNVLNPRRSLGRGWSDSRQRESGAGTIVSGEKSGPATVRPAITRARPSFRASGPFPPPDDFPKSEPAPRATQQKNPAGAGCLVEWRRGADSNRRIEVLQTSPLASWVPRRAPHNKPTRPCRQPLMGSGFHCLFICQKAHSWPSPPSPARWYLRRAERGSSERRHSAWRCRD